jgi:cyanophycin synthetase
MPHRADPGETGVELVELRVLDGPNRFFTRPAVKLEFAGDEVGRASDVGVAAGDAVRRLKAALGLPVPRIATRESSDRRRVAIAFPWRRRTISQAVGASAARIALGRSSERRELAGLRAIALGPMAHLPRPRVPIVAVTGTNGKSTTTRLIAHTSGSSALRTAQPSRRVMRTTVALTSASSSRVSIPCRPR